MYKAFLVDKNILAKDPHFVQGCASCHKGDEKPLTREGAHKGLAPRPSDNLAVCGTCHGDIAKTYGKALHYTTAGQSHGVAPRFSTPEFKVFQEKVFEKSCRSCHASCGDCHVQRPVISGVNTGLIKGHAFVKRDEGKTCALCHGGRVYPEFTGEYGGTPDVHYQKGMICLDCHKKTDLHGDGSPYASRKEIRENLRVRAVIRSAASRTKRHAPPMRHTRTSFLAQPVIPEGPIATARTAMPAQERRRSPICPRTKSPQSANRHDPPSHTHNP